MSSNRLQKIIRHPLFELFSSMRFAIALLTILAIACVIGTIIPQGRAFQDYVFQFGFFWAKIFDLLGLFDVYSSSWFVLIMAFLVISTSLCLIRHVPVFVRDMHSFRTQVTDQSLSLFKHQQLLSTTLTPEIAEQYLQAQGYQTRKIQREDEVLIAAKKGTLGKWGYILAHAALIIICLGGLLDSNLLLKLGVLTGYIVPDQNARYVDEFQDKSRIKPNTISFRGDISLPEKQSTNALFLHTGNGGYVLQELPFTVQLNKFSIAHYDNGMPKDFASDITVQDSKGKIHQAVVRVNHPFRIDGVSIYQANFGDGGSPLTFDAYLLPNQNAEFQSLKVRSLSSVPFALDDGKESYTLEFGEFKSHNVETIAADNADHQDMVGKMRSVQSDAKTKNFGPSITYTIKDAAGKAFVFMNYLLPQEFEGKTAYFYGVREPNEANFRWLTIPIDANGDIDTFMQLRAAFYNPEMIQVATQRVLKTFPQEERQRMKDLIPNLFRIFANGGFERLEEFIQTTVPQNDQERMNALFSQLIAFSTNQLLGVVLEKNRQPAWDNDEKRADFVLSSMQTMTALHHYPVPLFMQLRDFEEVQASGLQMTRSPGEKWVYLGAFLLTLGSILMFYVTEWRAWILIRPQQMRFAMTSGRQKQQINKRFTQHIQHLEQLIKDFSHESQS